MEGMEGMDPEDTELLNDVFRTIHTVKGAAGFLAFEQTVEVAHITEDILNRLRKGEMQLSTEIMDAVLQAVDMLKALLKSIEENMKEDKMETAPVVSCLRDILEASKAEGGKAPAPKAPAESDQAESDQAESAKKVAAKEKEYNIRVDISRLDAVMDLVGELVLARNRLDRIDSRLMEQYHENDLVVQLDEAVAQLSLATSDLQLAVMKMRMQPVSKVFNKFPRSRY